jgi:3-oxoacyl-[acyl-carrier-protein] synthase-1
MTVAVTASGLVTAVGFNADSTLAAVRAGVSGVKKVNLWDYESGQYISGARVELPQWWEGIEKLADLVSPAILECYSAAEALDPTQIPVLIGLPGPDRPLRDPDLDQRVLELVAHRLGGKLHPESRAIPHGQVSGVVGLAEARESFRTARYPACIIAGVDSFLNRWVAREYFKRRRLLTPGNSNGFIPGEAGSAVLLRPSEAVRGPSLEVLGLGLARESATIESDEPLRGDGLTEALGGALSEAGLTIFDAAYRITDLNGEQYKFKEAMIAAMRFEQGSRRRKRFELWHPIEYVGDIGAAIGPCVLALALHAGLHSYAPGPIALCHFGSDAGERAAAVVRFQPGAGTR